MHRLISTHHRHIEITGTIENLTMFICILCIAQGNVLIFQKNYYYLKKKIAETKIGRVNIMY
jgi:Mrp family chromosome partitioning ATPase